MMFDDDDDGVDQRFKEVDEYYFEDDDDEIVCFSILPFQFDDNDEVSGCGSEKKVYMRGLGDKRDEIHKRVEAWRIEFEPEQLSILMLSGGNWIKLLNPRRSYAERIARSILITLRMLHFVRKHPRDTRNLCCLLFDHLNEAFSKFAFKPTVDDLRNQYPLIKLFTEKDRVLMSSKILQSFLKDGYIKIEPNSKTVSTKVKFILNDEYHEINDNDGDYDIKEYNHGNCDDDDDDNDDDDDYSHNEDDSDDDASSDGHSDNDDGADPICAICDDGGKLLSCKGQCKRAFHATKKHGRRSGCETLGYTSTQQKRIATYICKNCKYKQHQCFKCGELEPSDEPNAKVFQCNYLSCGYFYHPTCVAQLLQPSCADGALEKKISARLSFPCPIHWCFKCNRMEDRTQEALQFLTCRRCPKSYHRQCLPREISFETKGKTKDQGGTTCAWELPQINFFYCPDHVDRATKTIRRDHIKFPPVPNIRRTRDPAERVKMTGKRKHSLKSTELSNRATNAAEKKTTSDVSRKGTVPSTRSTFVHSIQLGLKDASGQNKNDKAQEVKEKTGMHSDVCAEQNTSCVNQRQDIILENRLMEKDAEWDEGNYRTLGSVKIPEHHGSGKEQDKPKKDTLRGNGEQNHVFDSLAVERDTDEDRSNLQSGKVNGMEWEESACRDDQLSQQDGGAIDLEVYSTLCHANHKEPDASETELNSPQCSDDNRAAVTPEDRSKERTVSNTREELVHDMRGNSYKSPLRRNVQEMPTSPSPERQMMNYRDSYPINSYQCGYEQRCHVNCSCVDYFSCRKYRPLLDHYGNLVHGGYHAMNVDPFFQCSLQDNSNTAFQPCTDIRMGGHVALYGACNSEYEMRSDGLFGWVPWAPSAMSVPVNYATHPEVHLPWRQTYNQPRG